LKKKKREMQRLLCSCTRLNYCLQPAGHVQCASHVHEDAFVRVAWGRLPFADSVLGGGERVLLIGASPVDRYRQAGRIEIIEIEDGVNYNYRPACS